ncbi:MAG: hypothetical protein ABFC56_13710 [Clostridiaceae bacterium]
MEKNEAIKRAQFRGFLFELAIGALLEKNNFHRINPYGQPKQRIRENRSGFLEIKGRGCWHQIDCPYDYDVAIPFSYPLRLLGEVKFYNSKVGKEHIREFIGTLKDIQENYFMIDGKPVEKHFPRTLEFGVFISANGFKKEAERLAYAQGIKTLSYENNKVIARIKDNIYLLSEKYFLPNKIDLAGREKLRVLFKNTDYFDMYYDLPFFSRGYQMMLQDIVLDLIPITTNFIGTTATGIFLHFLGYQPFPFELFYDTDYANCKVYYDIEESNTKCFKLLFTGDSKHREYYFTPPSSLNRAASFGSLAVLRSKEEHFSKIFVTIKDTRSFITRQLVLNLDRDWFNAAYYEAKINN